MDKNYGWLVTHRGRIMSSEDGGTTWKTRYSEENQINLRNIKFLDDSIGWAVGHEGTILYTNDGGETWTNQSLSNFTGRDLPRLNGLTVLSETRAMLAGEFGVIAETVAAGHRRTSKPHSLRLNKLVILYLLWGSTVLWHKFIPTKLICSPYLMAENQYESNS